MFNWIKQRADVKALSALRYEHGIKPFDTTQFSALLSDDAGLLPHPTWVSHLKPSVFSEFNAVLPFSVCETTACLEYLSNSGVDVSLQKLLACTPAVLHTDTPILAQVVKLQASNSAVKGALHWDNFHAFGRFAYEDHLPCTDYAPPMHEQDDCLSDFACDLQSIDRRSGCSSLLHQAWCDRVVARNSGVSRRLAAIVYRLNEGDTQYPRFGDWPVATETIDQAVLNRFNRDFYSFVMLLPSSAMKDIDRVATHSQLPLLAYASGVRGITPSGYRLYLLALPKLALLQNIDARRIGPIHHAYRLSSIGWYDTLLNIHHGVAIDNGALSLSEFVDWLDRNWH